MDASLDDTGKTLTETPLLNTGNRTAAPRLAYSTRALRSQLSVWESKRTPERFTDVRSLDQQAPRPTIICQLCYEHRHTSPRCLLSIKDMPQLVANNQALTPAEKNTVPIASYLRTQTDYSNVLDHTPHSWMKPSDWSPESAQVPVNSSSRGSSTVTAALPNGAFIAEPTETSSDNNAIRGN